MERPTVEPQADVDDNKPIPRWLFVLILLAIAVYSFFIIGYHPGDDLASARARCQQYYTDAKSAADTADVDYRTAISPLQKGGRGLSCAEVSGRVGPRR